MSDGAQELLKDVAHLLGSKSIVHCTVADDGVGRSAADLAVCLDPSLIALGALEHRRAIARIVGAGRQGALVLGYEGERPGFPASAHEPMSVTMDAIDGVVAVPVSSHADSIAYVALRDPEPAHARDIRAAMLRRAVALTPSRSDLVRCVATSRTVLGFFPDHLARCIEYPWVALRIRAMAASGLKIADIGAGLNVLPLLLHDDGHAVTTVDEHSVDRTHEDRAGWNEWGYFDYSQFRPGMRSVRKAYEDFDSVDPFDVVYSVSVIEHLKADVRRRWLRRMAEQVWPEGRLLLTVDLQPLSRLLWNYSEGRLVEPAGSHGSIDDVLAELTASRFVVDDVTVFDWLPASRVGIALIEARRI